MKIYNTLTKKKEILEENIIKIYTCGVTIYDNCHIGHARIFLFFDSLIRYLKSINKKIILIRNITDIDDKIIKKAQKTNNTIKNITTYFKEKMRNDTSKLNIIEPTYEPKATFFIKRMIDLITELKKKNCTYKNKHQSIYFNTNNSKEYGKLSNQTQKIKKESYNKQKKNNKDFAIWKSFNKHDIFFYHTEWGAGRPGWHTECAAMVLYYAKNYIDIHGGGQDLLFPHHENELAQFNALNKYNLIKIWMHIGQIKIKKQKMSKSLGNHILIKNFLKKFDEEHLRLLILSSNYKKNIDYNEKKMHEIKKNLKKLYEIKENTVLIKSNIDSNLKKAFENALYDNFNTQKAISIIFKELKKNKTKIIQYSAIELLKILGLLKHKKNPILKKEINVNKIETLIKLRNDARHNKDWTTADNIRKKLIKMKIKIKDEKNNTTFEVN